MNNTRRTLLQLLAFAPISRLWAKSTLEPELDIQDPTAAYGETVFYDIYRKNKKIGNHTIRFATDTEKTQVEIESKIVVTVLKVPVYRFNYQSSETWNKGQLQVVTAATNDNGDAHNVTAKRSGDQMLLTNKDGETSSSYVAHSSNHWNSQVVDATILFNTLTGNINDVIVQNLGTEELIINKKATQANHYRLAGDLKTDVWYDGAGRWVQLRFTASDGNAIEYRCKGFNL